MNEQTNEVKTPENFPGVFPTHKRTIPERNIFEGALKSNVAIGYEGKFLSMEKYAKDDAEKATLKEAKKKYRAAMRNKYGFVPTRSPLN